jgi:hypothetical protein
MSEKDKVKPPTIKKVELPPAYSLTSANEKQTMKSFSFFGYKRMSTKNIVLA